MKKINNIETIKTQWCYLVLRIILFVTSKEETICVVFYLQKIFKIGTPIKCHNYLFFSNYST